MLGSRAHPVTLPGLLEHHRSGFTFNRRRRAGGDGRGGCPLVLAGGEPDAGRPSLVFRLTLIAIRSSNAASPIDWRRCRSQTRWLVPAIRQIALLSPAWNAFRILELSRFSCLRSLAIRISGLLGLNQRPTSSIEATTARLWIASGGPPSIPDTVEIHRRSGGGAHFERKARQRAEMKLKAANAKALQYDWLPEPAPCSQGERMRPFELLGLEGKPSEVEIRQAYRQRAGICTRMLMADQRSRFNNSPPL